MWIGGPKARVAMVYGGVPYGKQLQALRRGADVVVATPGRLKDLIDRNEMQLSDVSFVVLDEADRMADMGFLPEVRRILDQVRDDRQTLLFSATLDGAISTLIERYQHNPAKHEVEADEDAPENTHVFVKARTNDRVKLTAEFVSKEYSAIVFCRTKHGADRLADQLEALGVKSAAIHGDRSQKQRERALALFTSGKVQCLVATDIAARGIHVDNVGCVIHFDPAQDDKDYVHRSGRTGRAGTSGTVISMLLPNQVKLGFARARRLELDVEDEAPTPNREPKSSYSGENRSQNDAGDAAAEKPRFEGRMRKPEHKPERTHREFNGEKKFEKRNDWSPKPKTGWKPKAEYLAEKAARGRAPEQAEAQAGHRRWRCPGLHRHGASAPRRQGRRAEPRPQADVSQKARPLSELGEEHGAGDGAAAIGHRRHLGVGDLTLTALATKLHHRFVQKTESMQAAG